MIGFQSLYRVLTFYKSKFGCGVKKPERLIRRCRKRDISYPLKVGTKRAESVCIARTTLVTFLESLAGVLLTKRTSRKQHV